MKRQAFLVGGLALEMLLTPIFGALLGGYVDRKFSTTPWFFTVGLILGIFGAIRIGFRVYRIGKAALEGPKDSTGDSPNDSNV